jgi:hypothetical protein
MSYDPKCDELARHFLPDGAPESVAHELAQFIQNQIEDWLEYEFSKLDPAALKEQG